jgi:carbohydrate-binding DOMON domain-containing protein
MSSSVGKVVRKVTVTTTKTITNTTTKTTKEEKREKRVFTLPGQRHEPPEEVNAIKRPQVSLIAWLCSIHIIGEAFNDL